MGWIAARTPLIGGECGELRAGSLTPGSGGHGECLRRSRGEAAGVQPGAYSVNRMPVNVGTIRVCSPLPFSARARHGIGAMPTEGVGGAESP